MSIVTRDELYSFFETGDIPTQGQFADIFDSYIHQIEDGVFIDKTDPENKKFGVGINTPSKKLGIKAQGTDEGLISLHDSSAESVHKWSINLDPDEDSNKGFNIAQETAEGSLSKVFIQDSSGHIGLGTTSPEDALHIEGSASAGVHGIKILNNATVANNGWQIGHLQDADPLKNGALTFTSIVESNLKGMLLNSDGNLGINEQSPYTKLHVTLPESDPKAVISMIDDSGIVNIGPITKNVVADFRGLQARSGTESDGQIILQHDTLNLQRLGGDLLIHGEETLEPSQKMIFTNEGNLGIGTIEPQEKADIDGGVKIGNSTGTNTGTIRWSGEDFEGYQGEAWVSLTQGNGPWSIGEGNNIFYNNGTQPRVGIGTGSPDATLSITDTESIALSNRAAVIRNQSQTSSVGQDDHRIGLELNNTGNWGGDPLSNDIGLYVSEVNGQENSEHNLAAVINGNTIIGDLVSGGNSIGEDGNNVLLIEQGTAPTTQPSSSSVQLYTQNISDVSILHIMNSNGDVINLNKQSALTTADNNPVSDAYDGSVITLITNMRTRINELESKLQAVGIIA